MKQKWICFPIPGPLPQWQEAGPHGATREGPQDWGPFVIITKSCQRATPTDWAAKKSPAEKPAPL